MGDYGVDGLFLTRRETIRYLTGFTGSSGFVIVTPGKGYFLTDPRYTTQAKGEVKGFQLEEYTGKLDNVFLFIKDLDIKSLGFEGSTFSYENFRKLEDILPSVNLKSVSEWLDEIRLKKDEDEIKAIKRAIDISSKAFGNIVGLIEEGKVEKDIAVELEYQIKKCGADDVSFDAIVASGSRSALPHGKPSDKKICQGDTLIIDFGSTWNGYNSDETCTHFIGIPDGEQKKIFQIVKEAHDKAIEVIKPGVKASQVDSAARETIIKAGYGDYFGHGTGHGVGLAIHEKPVVSSFSDAVLGEGMVITVEPGIYIPDWGGVRIEDMVLVTNNGYEVLTYLSKGQSL
jgi:Xaa-Pro aminopeptidase